MTWHHVAALLIFATLTAAVILSPHADQATSRVFELDGTVIVAVFAHARTARLQPKPKRGKEARPDGEDASFRSPGG